MGNIKPTRPAGWKAGASPLKAAETAAHANSADTIRRAVAVHLFAVGRPGVFWTLIPRAVDPAVGPKTQGFGTMHGLPDLVLVIDGRTLWLTLIQSGGRASVQAACDDALRAAGAEGETAYGLTAALAQLKAWRAIP